MCDGSCSDYEIRVLCDCDGSYVVRYETPAPPKPSVCDPSIPHVEYPGDCYKFLHCMPMPDGSWQYTEKTCGPTMMFNPDTMVCDWVFAVADIKPECGKPRETTTAAAKVIAKCPPGEAWTDCLIPCANSCNYYGWVKTSFNLFKNM